jgi:hypothetical protein
MSRFVPQEVLSNAKTPGELARIDLSKSANLLSREEIRIGLAAKQCLVVSVLV